MVTRPVRVAHLTAGPRAYFRLLYGSLLLRMT